MVFSFLWYKSGSMFFLIYSILIVAVTVFGLVCKYFAQRREKDFENIRRILNSFEEKISSGYKTSVAGDVIFILRCCRYWNVSLDFFKKVENEDALIKKALDASNDVNADKKAITAYLLKHI